MSEMTVGCIRTTVTPPLASGIYEALLEKANRDNAELADRLSGLELSTTQKLAQLEQERDEARALLERKWDKEDPPLVRMMRERDHYKQSLEEISTTIQEYKDSIIQEPSEDFIWAIKAWADKKLNEL